MNRFRDIDSKIPGAIGRGINQPPNRAPGNTNGGSDVFGGRVPPQNIEAEIAVLGAMMLGERGAVERAAEQITREDFYREAHGLIFESMLHLAEKDEPVDIITLKDELGRRGFLESIGGIGYLMQLGEFVPTTANLHYHAQIIREKAVLRRLIEAASHIAGMAYGEVDEVDTVVDMAERTIFEVARKRSSQSFMPLRPLLNEAFEQVDIAYHEKGMITGLDTGFEDLNYMTSGFQDGDLIIIAARPSMGKCVKWDNFIVDPATGERVTIKDAVERQQSTVLRIDSKGRVGTAPVSHWVDSGTKPCWRVTTRTGRFVEVTGHHPFFTVAGWTPLHDLKPHQHIAIPRRVDACPESDYCTELNTKSLANVTKCQDRIVPSPLHQLIARTLRSNHPHIDKELAQPYEQDIKTFLGFTTKICVSDELDVQNRRLVDMWLKQKGWEEVHTGFFPAVWMLSKSHLARFLYYLLTETKDCYHKIYTLQSGEGIKTFLYHESQARDLQQAYARLGIVARFGRWRSHRWYVQIVEPQSIDTFLRRNWNFERQDKPAHGCRAQTGNKPYRSSPPRDLALHQSPTCRTRFLLALRAGTTSRSKWYRGRQLALG